VQYKITRAEQDAFAVTSHAKAAAAQKAGKFKDEIVPVATRVKDEKSGAVKDVVFAEDDGIRADTTLAGLSKLAPAFDKAGSTTAGTSSQVSDGAAAALLMTRKKAKELGLPVLGVFRRSVLPPLATARLSRHLLTRLLCMWWCGVGGVSYAVSGVAPEVMGIGPAFAIPAALKLAGLTIADVGLFELNEAFASQAVMSCKHLGLDMEKVNVNGGAIALGHPLGCTGTAFCISTSLWLADLIAVMLCVLRLRCSHDGYSPARDGPKTDAVRCRVDVHWQWNGCGCRVRTRSVDSSSLCFLPHKFCSSAVRRSSNAGERSMAGNDT
jgi:hypothetical protein